MSFSDMLGDVAPEIKKKFEEAEKAHDRNVRRHKIKAKIKKAFGAVSYAILWICAVGGFVLSLIQFLGYHK